MCVCVPLSFVLETGSNLSFLFLTLNKVDHFSFSSWLNKDRFEHILAKVYSDVLLAAFIWS